MSDREILKIIQSYNTTMLYLLTMYNRQRTAATTPTSNSQLSTLLQTLLQTPGSSSSFTEGDQEEEIVMSFTVEPPSTTTRTSRNSANTGNSSNTNANSGNSRLTQREIMEHTNIFVYTDESLPNTTCPISHVDFEPGHILCQIKSCQHTFKYTELMPWLDINSTCPVCRRSITA